MARPKTISRRPPPPRQKRKPTLPEVYQAKRHQRMPTPWYRQTPRGQSPKRGDTPLVAPKGGKRPRSKPLATKDQSPKGPAPIFEDMKGWNPQWQGNQRGAGPRLPTRKQPKRPSRRR